MQKVINELINNSIEGVDTYRWKDATWLIFTNQTRWVIELTDTGTLWYNYKFFDEIFRYASLTPSEGSDYITEWAQRYFFKPIDKRKTFDSDAIHRENKAVSIVNRGVKKTEERGKNHGDEFEWHTRAVVDNGVKKVRGLNSDSEWNIRNVMNNGIKETKQHHFEEWEYIGHIVDEGIKNTYPDTTPNDYDWSEEFKAEKVISNGKKI